MANGSGEHAHDHATEHAHDHATGHSHDHGDPPTSAWSGLLGSLRHLVAPHSHDPATAVDGALATSAEGLRCLAISFAVLLLTAVAEGVAVALTGSVAVFGDALHNLADALTALPLAVAFTLGRRAATPRYTYGFGRAEDLAGLVVVAVIAASSGVAAYAAVQRLLHPHAVHHLVVVGVAGAIGFVGNEVVARYRIRVGRQIGSAALVADGLHARTDGFTSLAVVLGAAGLAVGVKPADPLVGVLITVAILVVLRTAARDIYRRLMDAVEPELVNHVRTALASTPGVLGTGQVRVRWIGHSLRAECEVVVDAGLSIVAAHDIAEAARHRLLHDVARLTAALVHADPSPAAGADHHGATRHHDHAD